MNKQQPAACSSAIHSLTRIHAAEGPPALLRAHLVGFLLRYCLGVEVGQFILLVLRLQIPFGAVEHVATPQLPRVREHSSSAGSDDDLGDGGSAIHALQQVLCSLYSRGDDGAMSISGADIGDVGAGGVQHHLKGASEG